MEPENHNNYDISKKVLIIGDFGVGKSTMLECLTVPIDQSQKDELPSQTLSNMGYKIKRIEKNGQHIKLVIWDTTGQQKFDSLPSWLYRGCNAFVIAYDITNRTTFDNIGKWHHEMIQMMNRPVGCILVGNKLDLEESRVVSSEEGKSKASTLEAFFLETSAQTAKNIDKLADYLTDISLNRNQEIKEHRNKDDYSCNPQERQYVTVAELDCGYYFLLQKLLQELLSSISSSSKQNKQLSMPNIILFFTKPNKIFIQQKLVFQTKFQQQFDHFLLFFLLPFRSFFFFGLLLDFLSLVSEASFFFRFPCILEGFFTSSSSENASSS